MMMSNIRIARPEAAKHVPAFTVRKLEGTRTRTVRSFGKSGIVVKEVEVDGGYLVTFPKRHSIVVDEADLVRLGFDKTIPLLADDIDDPVGYIPNPLKGAA